MATKNIVPNADSEGGIGTSSKYWATGYIDAITTTGNLAVGGNIQIPNDGTIGSAGTNGALTISSGGAATFSGIVGINGSTTANVPLTATTSSGYEDVAYFKSAGTNIKARINLIPTGTGDGVVNATANDLVLQTGGADRLTISSGGITSLLTNQAKTSTSNFEYALLGKTNEATNYGALQLLQKGATNAADRSWSFQTIEAGVANAGNIVLQPSGGDVGIGTGTATPSQRLEVRKDDGVSNGLHGITDFNRAGGADAQLLIGYYANGTSVTESTIYSANSLPLSLAAGGSQKLTIGSNWTHNLDAYEEGTYTATMTPNTSGTITLNNKTLSYTRIGRVVHVTGYLDFASVSSPVGSVSINLPFTQATTTENPTACNVRFNGFSNSSYHANTPWAQCSNGVISIYSGNASGVLSNVAQEITTNCSVRIGVTYFTNA